MPDSLKASAKVDTVGSSEAAAGMSTGSISRGWQQQAWAYYDTVGELHYSMSFVGACLSRCKLTVGLPDDDGHIGPVFDEEGEAIKTNDGKAIPGTEQAGTALELIKALKSDVGGQAQLLRTMGINLGVTGEFNLVGSLKEAAEADVTSTAALAEMDKLQWEVLSTEEFRRSGEDYVRYRLPGSTPQEIPSESVHAIRVWRNHPRYSDLPDSSTKSVLDVLEELVLLTREVRGEAMSRLASAGLLLVPNEIEYPDDENDDSESDQGDPFTRDLIATMATAISDKGSAAQTVPFVIRAPGDQLHPDRFRHIDLTPKNSSDSAAKRKEAVQRLAQGIDLPVEIVTGHAQTTFSNAVQIDDSLFKSHIEPLLEIICDALTAAYLAPALKAGRQTVDSPLVVHFDSSELVARPNRAADAKDLHDRWTLSDASLRSAAGFSDSDAPDDDEILKRVEIKQAILIRQTIKTDPLGLETENQALNDKSAENEASIARLKELEAGNPPSAGQPNTAPGAPIQQGPQDGNNTDKTLAAAAFTFAAEVSIERAVKRVGARLRGKAAKEQGSKDQLSQVPDAEVAVTLGKATVKRLTKGDPGLFAEDFTTLANIVLRHTGDRAFSEALKDACIDLAEDRLYNPRAPFPTDQVPVLSNE